MNDVRGKRDMSAEVNFSDDPNLKEHVKFTIEGQEAVVSIAELHSFLMLVASEDQQSDLVPVNQQIVQKISKWHLVEAKKDTKKGEKFKIHCEVNVPVEVYNGLYGNMKGWQEKRKRSSIPIIKVK